MTILNFIFSPEWRIPSLILLVIYIIMVSYRCLSDDNGSDNETLGASIGMSIAIWIVLPILAPLLIIVEIFLSVDFEEIINDVFTKSKRQKGNSSKSKGNGYSNRKKTVELKITKLVQLMKDRKMVEQADLRYGRHPIDFGYLKFQDLGFSNSRYENALTIIYNVYRYTKDEDFKKIHSKIYDILIGTIDYYISVISDGALSHVETTSLIKEFNKSVGLILDGMIAEERIIINERKRVEKEIKDAKEAELSKISYDKFDKAKDSMLETFNIIAGVKK